MYNCVPTGLQELRDDVHRDDGSIVGDQGRRGRLEKAAPLQRLRVEFQIVERGIVTRYLKYVPSPSAYAMDSARVNDFHSHQIIFYGLE